MYGDYENWTYNYRKEKLMLNKIKDKLQVHLNKLFYACACGKKTIKTNMWLILIGVIVCLSLLL